MAEKEKVQPLLQRPLYLYALPTELLDTLVLKGDSKIDVPDAPPATEEDFVVSDSTGCTTCNIFTFADVSQQREHMRSDLHRFNLKRKLSGQKIVSADEFDKMLDDLNESISGSESDSSTVSSSSQDPLSKLLAKHTINSATETENKALKPHSPLIWFTSPVLPQPTSLGIYRAMFDEEDLRDDPLALLRYNQLPASKPPKRTIALMMIGGGHFAAIMVSLVPKIIKDHKGGEERQVDILASKGFHRYTTRRKQGGSQAANDSTGRGNAHSAGAGLRRYNEAALQKEVRELLGSWKDELALCELIFIRATGSMNRKTLFGYEGAVLKSNDKRIRGFPFTTKRPTKTELLRCFNELTRIKISHVDEASLATKAKQIPTVTSAAPKPQKTEEEKEEERFVAHSTALATLIQRKRIPALTAYLKDNNLSADFTLHPVSTHAHTSTLLHLAAASSLPTVVTHLLTLGANPTLPNASGKTPFEIAGDRFTRDRFRLARHTLGENKWNWEAAHVGKPLTAQAVAERDAREKTEQQAAKEEKAKENKRIAEEALKTKSANGATSSGGGGAGSLGIGANSGQVGKDTRGLSEEMKVKIERERRARAAEARFTALSSSRK